MCLSKTPSYTPPPVQAPAQEAKTPEPSTKSNTGDARRKMMAGSGTLLTSPSGIETSQLSLGKSSLLGG